jgi:phosphoribosylglycinamide formyltransferase-1
VENPLIAVLISGRGSNLRALIEAERTGRLGGHIAVVISNRAEAAGLAYAAAAGIETRVMPHGDYPSRAAYDAALIEVLRSRGVTLICLAGFMRLVSPLLCDAFPCRILNIHPSLLPAFPGTDAQRQAWEYGVEVTGVTVHFVTPELDAGPIVMQAAVPVHDDDTLDTLTARILAFEHQVYPEAVRLVLQAPWRLEGRRVVFDTVPSRAGTAAGPVED